MKITIYTITECQFSKLEKEYLTSHQLAFEEKNLEMNKEFLTEMMVISNNFAGTPVTKIDKDDGQIAVLKGFTKEEFDKVLGFQVESTPQQPTPTAVPSQPDAQVATPVEPPTPPPVSQPPVQAPEQPAPAAEAPTPVSTPPAVDPMANVLNTLQAQAQAEAAQPMPPPPAPPLPNIPDPKL